MAVLGWISIAFVLLEAGFCAYLWFELQKRVLNTAVSQLLKQSSEELSKDYGRQFRSIETEWDDMYQKFSRLAGRMDREKRPAPPETPDQPLTAPPTRSEIFRRWRSKA